MPKKRITDALRTGRILVSDGAWGTFLHKKGLQSGQCPEQWCVSHYDEVVGIAKSYIDAGANMVQSNSFGGTCFKLKHYGLADKVSELNEAAAKASRAAAGDECWVIASVGPTGQMLVTEDVTEDELYNAFKDQVTALERGGADALCIETMSAVDEAALAIKAAKDNTKLEVICTFTFEKGVRGEYRTMMGVSPADAARASIEAGADIVGTNCGNGIERMVEIVREIKSAVPDAFVLVHANAGLPRIVDGMSVFPESPDDMALLVPGLIEAGANIIGGCCGTTPEHIAAIKSALPV